MLNQQDSNGGKIHKGQEGSIRLVKSGGDSAKPLDFLKKTLHQMALLIQGPVYRPGIGDIAFGRNHIAGPVIRNIFPNRPGAIGPVCQHGTPADSDLFQQFNSVTRIVVISSGEKELHRVSQTVYDSVEFCVPPALSAVFSRCLRFHAPLRKWSPCSGSPYPRPQTECGMPLPECRHLAIWRIGRTQTARGHRPPADHATEHRSGRSRASR